MDLSVPEVVDVECDAERVADDEHDDDAEQDRGQLWQRFRTFLWWNFVTIFTFGAKI